jgi:hypothetical protein
MGDMVNTSVTTRYFGQGCQTPLGDLARVISKVTEREINRKKDEAKKVEGDFNARKAGGLWDTITAGPLAAFNDAIAEAQTDYNQQSRQGQGFLERYQSYMDSAKTTLTLASNVATGVVSSVVDELNVIDAVSEAAGLGSTMPTGGAEGCEDDLLTGTIATVFNIGKTAVDNAVQSVFAVHSSIGLALQVLPELYAGLMSQPAGLLSIILTNKTALLDRIESTVQQTMSVVDDMKDEDYPFDHKSFVLAAKAKLEEADSDMATVEDVLKAGGLFQNANWDRAKDTIKDTGDDLLSLGAGDLLSGFVHLKILQILGYQKVLETLIQVLDERQSIYAELTSNISAFGKNFQATAKFQNLMAPIVQQVRCDLQRIIADMDETVLVNSFIKYIVKEKWWGSELNGISIFMANTGHMGDELSIPSSQLNDVANSFSSSVSDAEDYFIGAESYDILTGLLSSFMRELKAKATRNTDPKILQGIATAIYSEIDRQRQSSSDLSELLEGFNSSIAAEGLVAVQAVAGLMGLMDIQGLDTLIDTIRNGDIGSFFSVEAATRQLESVARKAIGEVLLCCSENDGDSDATSRLLNMNRVMQDLQKGKELYDQYTSGYSEAYIQSVYKRDIPELTKMKKDVSTIKGSRCMNQGTAGSTGSPGLTLV